jgi:hypothetical protein
LKDSGVVFDELVNLMRVKRQLSHKHAQLARCAHSVAKRRNLLGKARRYLAQSRQYERRLKCDTFARKIDNELSLRIRRSVVPIFRETCFVMESGGTGTLFRVAESSFLVTASHALDVCDEGLGIYVPRFGTSHLVQIHGRRHRVVSHDIAVIELPQPVVDELGPYTYLTPDQAYLSRDRLGQGLYYVHGYPSCYAFPSIVEATIRASALNIPARRLTGIHRDIRTSSLPDEYILLNAFANAFDLNGISGCSIWLAHGDNDDPCAWHSESARVVAVETGTYRRHTIIEGTVIRQVFRMLYQALPALRPILGPHLGVEPGN